MLPLRVRRHHGGSFGRSEIEIVDIPNRNSLGVFFHFLLKVLYLENVFILLDDELVHV